MDNQRYAICQAGRHLGKNIDKRDKAHHHNMAGRNIGKKSDHQYQRLGKHTQHLNKGHNGDGQL